MSYPGVEASGQAVPAGWKSVARKLSERIESQLSGETRIVTVPNSQGFHARPVMRFVSVATQFSSQITVKKSSQAVDGKDPMEMMLLDAPQGTVLELMADGPDAAGAVDALAKLVESGFGET